MKRTHCATNYCLIHHKHWFSWLIPPGRGGELAVRNLWFCMAESTGQKEGVREGGREYMYKFPMLPKLNSEHQNSEFWLHFKMFWLHFKGKSTAQIKFSHHGFFASCSCFSLWFILFSSQQLHWSRALVPMASYPGGIWGCWKVTKTYSILMVKISSPPLRKTLEH